MKTSTFKRLAVTGVLAALAFSFLASGLRAEDSKVLRIGYQKSGAFLLVKNEGGLEKRLAPLGWKVEWAEFVAGVPLLEALGAGKLHLGHSGDAPVIFAQVAQSPIVYIAASRPSPESVGVLVPKDSPLKSVADLKGKKVIVGKGSSAHFFLANALKQAGLTFADITPVYLNPNDARPAFERGAGDAWAVWDPFLASAEIAAQARVLVSGKGISPFREFYLSHESFAKSHPEVVTEVLAELEAVGARAKEDPAKIAAFLAPQLKIDLPTLEKSELRKFRYGALPLTDDIVAEQQNVADLFAELALVPKRVKVADIVWKK
ncbi:MAG: aliphatic sulfonate ABC transporter substrate-binding protein [Nibricoccus sp.]